MTATRRFDGPVPSDRRVRVYRGQRAWGGVAWSVGAAGVPSMMSISPGFIISSLRRARSSMTAGLAASSRLARRLSSAFC